MNKNKQRQHIRLALPALCDLTLDTPLAFALLGRDGRVLRAGELPLRELAPSLGNWPVQVALQAGDAVVASVAVPPVPARRLSEVVFSVIEPMVLSNLSQLLLAHGPRRADGSVVVAWGDRTRLAQAWALLQEVGLQPVSLVPQALALPADDPQPAQSLVLPVGPRWLGDWPAWSLADGLTDNRNGLARWHRPLVWSGLAVAIWVLGLNLYAGQQQGRLDDLNQAMRQTVEQAFPQISVVIDPLRQAQQQRDALRLSGGDVTETDFLPLAMAAADVLGFAQGQVRAVQYQDGVLSLDLVSGYQPPASLAALQQAAAARHILVEHDEAQPQRWQVREGNAEGAKK
ncbi:type II secretion system protein GspL [Castellaniella sp.]|uniref:type II secretion system protein GspL n=1 Tax=Castellaniella sp. TaxID=1955812 RepID=UPI002AFE0A78|nr:type II secretion system protein GspL [Castellaniella sp.]